jgi:hypothetical protein
MTGRQKNTIVIFDFGSCHTCVCQIYSVLHTLFFFYMLDRCDLFMFMCMAFLSLTDTHVF